MWQYKKMNENKIMKIKDFQDTENLRFSRVLELRKIANDIRKESLIMIHRAQSGHPGGSLSEADILAALYFYKLRLNQKKPNWKDRDRFILSKGHRSEEHTSELQSPE